MAPGNAWEGSDRAVNFEYMVNTAADSVLIWRIPNDTLTYLNNDTATNIPVSSATYAKGELQKTITKDEAGNVKVEYRDKEGQIILRKAQIGTIATDYIGYAVFLSTYYIYDDFGRLRMLIQPKAVALMVSAGSWQLTGTITNELTFRYEYDSRHRMVARKVPGASWDFMIYDQRDRLVFTQDGCLRNSHLWLSTLYDPLNRNITTGIIRYTGSPSSLQNYVSAQTATASLSILGVQASDIKDELYVNNCHEGQPNYLAESQDWIRYSLIINYLTAECVKIVSQKCKERKCVPVRRAYSRFLPVGANILDFNSFYRGFYKFARY